MSTSALVLPIDRTRTAAGWAMVAFVASYSSSGIRQAYSTQLRLWFDWCQRHGLEPLTEVRRPHVELYAPTVHIRRPKVSQESLRLGLDRTELGAFLVGGLVGRQRPRAGLPTRPQRPTPRKPAVPTWPTDGPLMARTDGSRLDRHAAITAALDAGFSLRDVQDFARHADPRQTRRYDRARGALDHNLTYIVAWERPGATHLHIPSRRWAPGNGIIMHVQPRSLGAAIAIVGIVLWVVAMVVDASLVAVILPILMVMGGGALIARRSSRSANDGSPQP